MLFYFTLSFNSYPNGPVVWAISFDSTCPVSGSCLSSPVTLAAVQCSVAAGGKEGVVAVPGCPWAVPQVQLWQWRLLWVRCPTAQEHFWLLRRCWGMKDVALLGMQLLTLCRVFVREWLSDTALCPDPKITDMVWALELSHHSRRSSVRLRRCDRGAVMAAPTSSPRLFLKRN